MTKTQRLLVRDIRAAFINADRRTLEQTQQAAVSKGAWLHAWALETLLNDK